ncbi:SusC/RagA family TonB-linked outer membrane protein [Sphingobacterium pedocola]|uniref:SusC/RagA family TonB-linked outer membrane protein n=1 Tax=Sphingobacterium pedocola TaxID=2082722 RepID=A0ABR9T294_9SPHI|nr:SusC/RagA family TonB-linked outer membrane protein [Sphingobacterium pedocola]MBE8719453.1 SusC/RagA family TonB-linked outer membrane protein [Sphingobacterium pedocola]
MKQKLLSFILVFTCLVGASFAQDRQVSGKVTSAADGTPVSGVSVAVVGATIATQTDGSGNYSLSVPANSTLLFSYIGYTSQRVPVGSQTVLNVQLESDETALEEVVVTAMGIERSAKSLGYAVAKLGGDEITKARETNVVNALAGKVAGVRVTSQSGTPGGSSKIVIRGVSSVSSSGQPIFVIDGLPVDNGSPQVSTVNSSVPQGSAGADFGNRAGDINPDDVESMTVLKGAAATALYGARAKDGAIIITTKKGKKGQGTVTFNSSARFDNILKTPEFQNDYAQGVQGVYSLQNTNGWGPKISEVQDLTFENFLGENVTLQAYPDNYRDFYETGSTYINNVAFQGADDHSDYRFSYTNTQQSGIVPGSKFARNNIGINAGRKILEGLEIRGNVNYNRTTSDGRPVQSSNNPNVLQNLILTLPRTVNTSDLRDNYVDPVTGEQITLTPSRTGNNPYWIVNNNNVGNVVDRVYGNGIVTYKPTNWLTISDNFGTDFYYEKRLGTTRNGTIGALTGNFYQGNIQNRLINNDFIVTAETKLTEDLGLKVIAGHNVYETYYERVLTDAQELTVEELYNFANAASVSTTNTSNKSRLVGVYGDIGLSYKDFLFLNVTGRNDWSSTLPASNNSYFYPSVSSSFIFSEVLPSVSWFNYGKLRASWANVGSGTDPYSINFVYNPQSVGFAQYGYGSQFPFNGVLAFSAPGTIPNLNLKPQNQSTYEIGTDLAFLNNRVTLDFTYYYSNTTDQIVRLNIPQSTGFSLKSINAGSVKNQGIEVALGIVPVKSQDFSWNMDFNFSRNKQTVSLPEEVPIYNVQSGWSGLQVKAEAGKSFQIFGGAWERDPNGNIVIDEATGLRKTVLDQPLGNVFPDWMLGINNSFAYKNLSFGFLLDIRKGGVIYSNTVSTLRTSGLGIETLENRGSRMIDPGVVLRDGEYVANDVPVQSMEDFWGQFSTTNTEGNIFDASYVKLREVVLSYQLPSKWLQGGPRFIKGASVGLEGRNLWLIKDNVPHIDPEVNLFGPSSLGEGVEFNSVPSTRTIGFNLRVQL